MHNLRGREVQGDSGGKCLCELRRWHIFQLISSTIRIRVRRLPCSFSLATRQHKQVRLQVQCRGLWW